MKEIPFRRFGVMIDMSRNAVMKPAAVKDFAVILKKMGYNTLLLYTEDTYEIPEEPYFGYLRGRYTTEEIRDIVDFCETLDMEVIPCIQTLAHLGTLRRWPVYEPIFDVDDILLIDDERTYELMDRMFASLRRMYKTDIVNIGMDEAAMIGLGRYLQEHGLPDRYALLCRHLSRVCELAARHGFKPVMWADMFFHLVSPKGEYLGGKLHIPEGAAEQIPEEVGLIFWDYYFTNKAHYVDRLKTTKAFGRETWFAGGAWTWTGFVPRNRFSLEINRAAIPACLDEGIENVFLTLWGDNGGECSRLAVLPSLFYAAELARGEKTLPVIREHFREMFGLPFAAAMDLDLFAPKEGSPVTVTAPDKNLLFNDPFLGIYDPVLTGQEAAAYKRYARKLAAHTDDPLLGMCFRKEKALAELMAVKSDLGQKTREAYLARDAEALTALIPLYKKAEKLIRRFTDVMREAWLAENKPHGLEIQEMRLGGLMERVRSCRLRLEDYLAAGMPADAPLPELEEVLLDPEGKGEPRHRAILERNHSTIVSVNRL